MGLPNLPKVGTMGHLQKQLHIGYMVGRYVSSFLSIDFDSRGFAFSWSSRAYETVIQYSAKTYELQPKLLKGGYIGD